VIKYSFLLFKSTEKHDNTRRLHSALGYVTPADKMAGREPAIFAARDRKLEAARGQRQVKRQAARAALIPAVGKSSLTSEQSLRERCSL
jgi:hypothetical protein